MADLSTTIAAPTERMSRRLTRQDTFFDVAMSTQRLDRIVPIMAIHETASASQGTKVEYTPSVFQNAPGQACKAVLATPELLQNILIFLPESNIFGITRVSRAFRNCVAASPRIQEKLFFRPSGPPKEVWQVLGPQFSWYFAIRKRRYLKVKDHSECRPDFECLVTPVILNPCARIISTSSNYKVKINLPKIHSLTERGGSSKLAHLLKADGLATHISVLDTYISQPNANEIDLRLHIALVDHVGTIQAEIFIRQNMSGQDALTSRSALKVCWESTHTVRLWRRGEWKNGNEYSCYWVMDVKISELVERLEEQEKLTAVIGDSTTFVLCNAMVPSEATRAAVEVEVETE
ncbi:hypothetical protein MBLNU13_g07153t2 [Cladosporium sp. NU13]